MKNRCFDSMSGFFSLLALFFFCSQNATAQNACPNPAFPGCQPPGSVNVFKVLLGLDIKMECGRRRPALGDGVRIP